MVFTRKISCFGSVYRPCQQCKLCFCPFENFCYAIHLLSLSVILYLPLILSVTVVIGVKEVSVYPDDSCKPEVGRGLNKPARVTLEQAWPFCKTTRQPITDPDRLDKMGYEEKLRRSTAKIGGTFIEYDRQTGTCVFEVRVTQFRVFQLVRPSPFSQLFS